MEFNHSFIPVFMKYDLTSENYERNKEKDWIECRVNVRPNVANRWIRINIYPKNYNEMLPNIAQDICSANIDYGLVKSRKKSNVLGVLWTNEQNKKCRFYIAFENKEMRRSFSKYFEELVKLCGIDNAKTENEHLDLHTECKLSSSVCNEAEKMASTSGHQTDSSSIQIMRVSNASSSYEDDVLRAEPAVQTNRLAKYLAAISGLFKSFRRNNGTNHKKNDENAKKVTPTHEFKRDTNKTKSKTWNIFKLKEKTPYDTTSSFLRFDKPSNHEDPSLLRGDVNMYSDAQWYDLNKDEMSFLEAQVSTIVSEFNSCKQISGNSVSNGSEPSNSLWSHSNLLTSFKPNARNLLTKTANNIQAIHSKKPIKPMILIDDIMTKPINSDCDSHSDESCKLSSGFGSGESNTNSPQEFVRKFKPFSKSPSTSTYRNAIFSSNQSNHDATPLAIRKTMEETLKKHRMQINSRKLFGILCGKHTSPPPVNVTPQYKSPSECRSKRVRNGTPFKIRSMQQKQTHVTEVESQRLVYPIEMLI